MGDEAGQKPTDLNWPIGQEQALEQVTALRMGMGREVWLNFVPLLRSGTTLGLSVQCPEERNAAEGGPGRAWQRGDGHPPRGRDCRDRSLGVLE